MRIDGKAIAESVLQALESERSSFGALTLGIVMSEGDKATESFVKIKTRMAERLGVEVRRFAPEQMAEALMCNGIIVQLPIPNSDSLLASLPPEKDLDALGLAPIVRAPVAEAVAEVLARSAVEPRGKKAVVVGAGRLVGAPVATLLREAGAEVSAITQTHGSLEELKTADIVVLGAGEPGLIKPEMLKEGVVLIDAGTSESAGKVAGDADPACEEVASVFTPVPGGIGPIAVAMIFKNLFALAKKNSDR
jgi:methylenetetrahydrofolate dehydrogenase (NADP+)/methenyltetrahydrofolate cyclohydrolase